MKLKQLSFLPKIAPVNSEYGGGKEKGKRKTARPFSPKLPLHVVLRAMQAKGEWSLLSAKNKVMIENLLYQFAERYQIKIYRFQNVGNHLHLLIQTRSPSRILARQNLSAFLRCFAGIEKPILNGN